MGLLSLAGKHILLLPELKPQASLSGMIIKASEADAVLVPGRLLWELRCLFA